MAFVDNPSNCFACVKNVFINSLADTVVLQKLFNVKFSFHGKNRNSFEIIDKIATS